MVGRQNMKVAVSEGGSEAGKIDRGRSKVSSKQSKQAGWQAHTVRRFCHESRSEQGRQRETVRYRPYPHLGGGVTGHATLTTHNRTQTEASWDYITLSCMKADGKASSLILILTYILSHGGFSHFTYSL